MAVKDLFSLDCTIIAIHCTTMLLRSDDCCVYEGKRQLDFLFNCLLQLICQKCICPSDFWTCALYIANWLDDTPRASSFMMFTLSFSAHDHDSCLHGTVVLMSNTIYMNEYLYLFMHLAPVLSLDTIIHMCTDISGRYRTP